MSTALPASAEDKLHELITSLIEGQATDEQGEELSAMLQMSPTARSFYLAYLDLHANLFEEVDITEHLGRSLAEVDQTLTDEEIERVLAAEAGECVETNSANPPAAPAIAPSPLTTPPREQPRSYVYAAVFLALVAEVALVVFMLTAPGEPAMATLEQLDGRFAAGTVVAGDELPPGKYDLAAGVARVRFANGAQVAFEGPAQFELYSEKRIHLAQGKLLARVPAAGRGFTVETPGAAVIDLGTEFGVAVEADTGTAEVHVFEGRVEAELTPRADQTGAPPAKIELAAAEAKRIITPPGDRTRQPQIEDIVVDAKQFAKARVAEAGFLPPAAAAKVVQQSARRPEVNRPLRVAFLGDSITTGHTYLMLIEQAIAAAHDPRPQPVLINAGGGGNRASDMLARLDRDVIPARPDIVFLSTGLNDAVREVNDEDFQATVAAITDRLDQAGIRLAIMTTSVPAGKHEPQLPRLERFNEFLRKFAHDRGYKLADVNRRFLELRRQTGRSLLVDDDFHPDEDGQLPFAKAVLAALGYSDVDPPRRARADLEPGVIPHWWLQPRGPKRPPPLDAAAVAALQEDATWLQLDLPQPQPHPLWWRNQERQRGYAISIDGTDMAGPRYVGIAYVDSAEPRTVYFYTGGHVWSIWLNGQQLLSAATPAKWQVGTDRVKAQLHPGRNKIVIECGNDFFFAVRDQLTW